MSTNTTTTKTITITLDAEALTDFRRNLGELDLVIDVLGNYERTAVGADEYARRASRLLAVIVADLDIDVDY